MPPNPGRLPPECEVVDDQGNASPEARAKAERL